MGGSVLNVWRLRLTRMGVMLGVLSVLVCVLTLAVAPVASAAPGGRWADLAPEVLAAYDVTKGELATIDPGNPDGTWRPFDAITRGELVKMAVREYGIKLSNPQTPTYLDVLKGDPLYKYIEGATAAGLVVGFPDGYFRPDWLVTGAQLQAVITVRWGYDLDPAYTYDSNPLTRIEAASMLLHSSAPSGQ